MVYVVPPSPTEPIMIMMIIIIIMITIMILVIVIVKVVVIIVIIIIVMIVMMIRRNRPAAPAWPTAGGGRAACWASALRYGQRYLDRIHLIKRNKERKMKEKEPKRIILVKMILVAWPTAGWGAASLLGFGAPLRPKISG